jgi:antitoxin YefM
LFDRSEPLEFVQIVKTISETEAGGCLSAMVDEVALKRKPIGITRDGEQKAVLIAADEFAAIEESLYLLSTPANSERIRQGIADFNAGKIQTGELCD